MWTTFFDMSSGGFEKTQWPQIHIELPEKQAIEFFEEAFDRNPRKVTCKCCGPDFSISEDGKRPEETPKALFIGQADLALYK